MSRKEITAKKESFLITAVVGILCLLLLLLNFKFKKENNQAPLMIEIAMVEEPKPMTEEINYGNTELGQGPEEPAPATEAKAAVPEPTPVKKTSAPAPTPKPIKAESTPAKNSPVKSKTQTTTKKLPVASENPVKATTESANQTQAKNKKTASQPQGDSQGKSALENILGGIGKNKSSGQGTSGAAGNYGDPKGTSSQGKNIGENWKTRVPEGQSHNCEASGSVMVDIVVNANGSIKRATPRPAQSQCLADTAKKLVLKYVTAYPGEDGRRGTYLVNLK
ncbi:hypothetical protein EQP59_01320 [Ornithobacterium rhinotracheale]|uniref:Energy transducer TonB n=1 Tax=Ornithobacterium rhinotracheale TaxID=28251 RepID=A0A3R5UUJ9_ORNRH|nr:hypothetical protein [Ornithobacterium rhinotracheale]QAR30093.1 hypothetical protein EQP59_01320 [Ornithobacterium rhinotracheale]